MPVKPIGDLWIGMSGDLLITADITEAQFGVGSDRWHEFAVTVAPDRTSATSCGAWNSSAVELAKSEVTYP